MRGREGTLPLLEGRLPFGVTCDGCRQLRLHWHLRAHGLAQRAVVLAAEEGDHVGRDLVGAFHVRVVTELRILADQGRRARHPVALDFGLGVHQGRIRHALQDHRRRLHRREIGGGVAGLEVLQVLRGQRAQPLAAVHVMDQLDQFLRQRPQRRHVAAEVLFPFRERAIARVDELLDRVAAGAVRIALRRARHAAAVDQHEATDALRMPPGEDERDLPAGGSADQVEVRHAEPPGQLGEDRDVALHVVDALAVAARQAGIHVVHADHAIALREQRRREAVPAAQAHERRMAQHHDRRIGAVRGRLVDVVHPDAVDVEPARLGPPVLGVELLQGHLEQARVQHEVAADEHHGGERDEDADHSGYAVHWFLSVENDESRVPRASAVGAGRGRGRGGQRELPLGAEPHAGESGAGELAAEVVADLRRRVAALHRAHRADHLARHPERRHGDRHLDQRLAEARHAAMRIADARGERLALHVELHVDAVVVDRRIVRVLYAHLHQQPQLEPLALQRLDARDRDLRRVALRQRGAAGERQREQGEQHGTSDHRGNLEGIEDG